MGTATGAGCLHPLHNGPDRKAQQEWTFFWLWLCIEQEEKGSTGPLGSGPSGGLCDYQTQVLSNGLDLEILEIDVKPAVKFKKFIYLFNTETRIADFPDTNGKAAYTRRLIVRLLAVSTTHFQTRNSLVEKTKQSLK